MDFLKKHFVLMSVKKQDKMSYLTWVFINGQLICYTYVFVRVSINVTFNNSSVDHKIYYLSDFLHTLNAYFYWRVKHEKEI